MKSIAQLSTGRKTVLAVGALAVLLTAASTGCKRSSSRTVTTTEVIVPVDGVVAGDLQSIADYLDLPQVQEIFLHMERNSGSDVPDVTGEYESTNQTISFTTIPGSAIGELLDVTAFCFDGIAGARLDVTIADASFVDVGAPSFIEGDGDEFTVFVAHKSIQAASDGATCEIHMVRILSGRRENDGSVSDLEIGVGIIGIVGNCENLIVGDVQVSRGSADRIGDGCGIDIGPVDPGKVLVRVENFLVEEIDVFTSNDGFVNDETFVPVAPLEFAEFEEDPNFELEFVSLQPLHPNGEPMGEILAKLFEVDETPPGETVIYQILNNIDDNLYFSPFVTNDTGEELLPVVNVGIPDTPGGFFCEGCTLLPAETLGLGYYAYDIFAVIVETNEEFFWLPDDVNIEFYAGTNVPVLSQLRWVMDRFEQPGFELEDFTGAIDLAVPDDAALVTGALP